MTTSCDSVAEMARKSLSLVLQGLSESGAQTSIAKTMGVSDATISREKTEHLETLVTIISLLGLKIVPASDISVNQDRLNALILLSHYGLSTQDDLRRAVMDDHK